MVALTVASVAGQVHGEDYRWDVKLPLSADVHNAVEQLAPWLQNLDPEYLTLKLFGFL